MSIKKKKKQIVHLTFEFLLEMTFLLARYLESTIKTRILFKLIENMRVTVTNFYFRFHYELILLKVVIFSRRVVIFSESIGT